MTNQKLTYRKFLNFAENLRKLLKNKYLKQFIKFGKTY